MQSNTKKCAGTGSPGHDRRWRRGGHSHGKSNAVLVPALAAVTLREAVDYQALDGAPVRLLFLIAAPDGANDLHIQVLARLAQLLMEPLFCEELKQAATPEEFLAVIAKREQGETAREARAEAVAEAALTEPRLAPACWL